MNVRRHIIHLTLAAALALATGCGSGGGGGAGAPAPGPGGSLSGNVVDGPIVGALVNCVQVDAAGNTVPPLVGQATTGADGAFAIAVDRDVPGPILCASSGGNNGTLPAPDLYLALPDGLAAGATASAHINPFTTIAYQRIQATGDFSVTAIRSVSDSLASALGISGDIWAAQYNGSHPDDLVMTRLLNGFDQALVSLNTAGGDPVTNANAIITALDTDTADGTLNGTNGGLPIPLNGTTLAAAAPNLTTPPSGAPPVADAGPDRAVVIGDIAQLDGSASTDPDGDPLSYLWRVVSAPASVSLSDPTVPGPEFTPTTAGDYVFSLTVGDGQQASLADTVTLTARGNNGVPLAVIAPVGPVQTGDTITLDGGNSSDPDNDPLTFAWTIDSRPVGSTVFLVGGATATPTLVPDRAGDYSLLLVVNDGIADSTAASRVITVAQGPNRAPTADAGLSRTIGAGAQVVLDGSASFDPDGDPLSYLWTITAQPPGAGIALSSNTAPRPVFTPQVQGDYWFSLSVDDGALSSAPATVNITVTAPPNRPPVADAGIDFSALRNGLATLDGSGSTDPDGDAIGYAWRIVSQPTGAAIALSATDVARPSFIGTVSGTYDFSLTVNDGNLDSPADLLRVTVSTIANRAPIANAGADQGVTVFTLVSLDGTASGDPDGDPISYQWQLTGKPTGSLVTLAAADTANASFTPDLAGSYTLSLTVNDGALTSPPATVTVSAADSGTGGGNLIFDGQARNDWLGYAVSGPGDVNGDGTPDIAVGAHNNGNGAGQVQVFSGADGSLIHGLTGLAAGDFYGRALGSGDVDADGRADLIIGAYGNDTTATGAGMVEVVTGASGAVLYRFYGDAGGDSLGKAVSGAGDVNGDGHADIIAGAPTAGGNTGYARVYSGIDGGVFHTFSGNGSGEQVGFAVAGIGDINGDGKDDLLVGAPGVSGNGTLSGQATVYNGLDGSAIHVLDGPEPYSSFGQSVAGLGDVSGDNVPDFAVGAPNYSGLTPNAGRVIVYSGADGGVLFTLDGTAASDQFGISVAGAGDINGDGIRDLIVGAPGNDDAGASAGQARVFSGADGTPLVNIDGLAPYDGLGRSVAGIGDVNGDGFADLVTGAPGNDTGAPDAGRAEVFLGAP